MQKEDKDIMNAHCSASCALLIVLAAAPPGCAGVDDNRDSSSDQAVDGGSSDSPTTGQPGSGAGSATSSTTRGTTTAGDDGADDDTGGGDDGAGDDTGGGDDGAGDDTGLSGGGASDDGVGTSGGTMSGRCPLVGELDVMPGETDGQAYSSEEGIGVTLNLGISQPQIVRLSTYAPIELGVPIDLASSDCWFESELCALFHVDAVQLGDAWGSDFNLLSVEGSVTITELDYANARLRADLSASRWVYVDALEDSYELDPSVCELELPPMTIELPLIVEEAEPGGGSDSGGEPPPPPSP